MRNALRIAILSLVVSSACAQSSCPPLQAPSADPSRLLFTAQQESELGEIVRQQFETEFRVVDEDRVIGYLEHIGERVARHLPATGLTYEFLLYDQPEIQAFSMPGGRVYVSRKMVAFLRSEDELAGLLGHELGHLAVRQQALDMSSNFREVLGLKSVPPDEDLYALYNQYIESVRLKRHSPRPSDEEDKSQKIADLIGVQAVARAGYSPKAFPDLLDRIMETKGKTGSWFSDLFGATSPNSKRLREALKDVAALPASCIDTRSVSPSGEFHDWQTAVLHYQGIGHQERLRGVLVRKQFNEPLRADIESFRFSPDGKYLLAQDEGGIYVLTRDPLKFVFRIDAADAQPAQFSPDSQQIVFFSSGLRVETWSIERQEQILMTDVPAIRGCRQTELSPDAKYFACFGKVLDLSLFNVATGEEILKKEHFFDFDQGFGGYSSLSKFFYLVAHKNVATLRFSPDGHYFAASSRTKEVVAFDLASQKPVNLSGSLHTAMAYSFAFIGPDRLAGIDDANPQKSLIVEFPSGKVVDHIPLGGDSLTAATNPKYILIRPLKEDPVGAFSVEQKKLVFANRMDALDLWGEYWASERLNGEIGIYKTGELKPIAKLQLPLGKLGVLRAYAASPDLKWLAISGRTRAAIWGLDANERIFHMRSFQNAYYASNGVFFVDFPEFEKSSRAMVVISPVTRQSKERMIDKDDDVTFFGDVFVRTKHNDANRRVRHNFELNAMDMATASPLWSRTFPKQGPWVSGSPSSGKLIFVWNAKADGLRDELKGDANLQARWGKDSPRDTDYFMEVLNARDGTIAGGVVLRTGKYSFFPEHQVAVADWLAVADNVNRVLLYSISTGEQKAKWFGSRPQISRNGEYLCLSSGRGSLTIYNLRTLRQVSELSFANRLSAYVFSEDGKRLFALTDDQTAFIIDVEQAGAPTNSAKN